MKHYKSVEFLSNFQNVKTPYANAKPTPLFKTFWQRFWFKPHVLSSDAFVTFVSLQSEKVTNTRIVNLEVVTIWVRFTWRLCSCVRDLFRRGKRVATWSSHYAAHILYVQYVCFLGNCIFWMLLLSTRKNWCETFQKRRPVFCQIFNRDVFGWFACEN